MILGNATEKNDRLQGKHLARGFGPRPHALNPNISGQQSQIEKEVGAE